MTDTPAVRGELVLVTLKDSGDGGRVVRVTVNNPERRNALGNAEIAEVCLDEMTDVCWRHIRTQTRERS